MLEEGGGGGKERMLENIDVFDFVLSQADMQKIAAMNKDTSSFFSPL